MKYKDFNNIVIENSSDVCSAGKDTFALAECAARPNPKTALDLGTGTGFIAIYLASKGIKCSASDISDEAVELAKKNILKNALKIDCIKSDLFESISGKFDLIVFNTPLVKINPSFTPISRYVRKLFPNGVPLIPTLAFMSQSKKRKKILERFMSGAREHCHEKSVMVLLIHKMELRLFSKHKLEIMKYYSDFRIIKIMSLK